MIDNDLAIMKILSNEEEIKKLNTEDKCEIALYLETSGWTVPQLMQAFQVPRTTIYSWLQRARKLYKIMFDELEEHHLANFHRQMRYNITKMKNRQEYYKAGILENMLTTKLMDAGKIKKAPSEVNIKKEVTLKDYLLKSGEIEDGKFTEE